jgi:putative oxidoreductase
MIGKTMKKCSWCSSDMGLLALRVGLAGIFIFAGWMKVSNLDGTIGAFGQMGFSPMWAYIVAFAELIGGVAILLGFYTRFFAALLAIVMLIATLKVHKDKTLLLHFFSLLALMLAGGGRFSIVRKACGCGSCRMCVESDVAPKASSATPSQM